MHRLAPTVLLALALLALILLAPRPAEAAEEVFILDNGTVFRGHVVGSGENRIEVKLVGFGSDARVSIQSDRIVQRFVTVADRPEAKDTAKDSPFHDWSAGAQPAGTPDRPESPTASLDPTSSKPLPAEEPSAKDEGFFQRLARVAVLSLPPGPAGRTTLALLFFVALLALVGLGCRLAEIEGVGLGRVTILASLLGVFLVSNVFFHDVLLRADRATWVLPIQGVAWLVVGYSLLRCGLPRAILLFAFLLFSLAVVVFSAGAILVTF